jgi:hypothetical protein
MPARVARSSRTLNSQAGAGGLAAHQVGDGEGEHAVEDVDADLLVGPVEHGGERHDGPVLELAEAGFGIGLGAVGGDDIGDRPVGAVGEQDPFAEHFALQSAVGGGIGAPGDPQLRGVLAGEGDGDDPVDSAGAEDRRDLGLHAITVFFGCCRGPVGPAARRAGGGPWPGSGRSRGPAGRGRSVSG